MEKVKCVKCHNDVEINIANAQDEDGEVFICPNCGQTFRYAKKWVKYKEWKSMNGESSKEFCLLMDISWTEIMVPTTFMWMRVVAI